MSDKSIKFFVLFLLIILPFFAFAQGTGVVPNCATDTTRDPRVECGFADLVQLINNVIGLLIRLAIPISAIVFAYSGFELMTTGISDKKSQAKERIQKVFIGLVIILSAWIITTTLTRALIRPGIPVFIGN